MGTLYLVATPIGNLEDITLRALRTLRGVALIAAEDTRVTRQLLRHYQIETPLTSYHEHNKLSKLPELLDRLRVGDLALVSDAGMPGLSDPGYELVKASVDQGVKVVPVPGASAVISALVTSGLPTDGFVYLGFLPRRSGDRRRLLESLADERRTLVAYEAPHRLLRALETVGATLGQRSVAVARELTKLHEQVVRGTPSELGAHFAKRPPKGEITLVISGAPPAKPEPWDDMAVRSAVAQRIRAGDTPAAAAKAVTKMAARPRSEVYQMAVEVASGNPSS
jgi:16S rRNA (cytidine1402-2'-O)-methyltransferase